MAVGRENVWLRRGVWRHVGHRVPRAPGCPGGRAPTVVEHRCAVLRVRRGRGWRCWFGGWTTRRRRTGHGRCGQVRERAAGTVGRRCRRGSAVRRGCDAGARDESGRGFRAVGVGGLVARWLVACRIRDVGGHRGCRRSARRPRPNRSAAGEVRRRRGSALRCIGRSSTKSARFGNCLR